ncbi:GMC oxidoreductase [Micromonospora coriariae]|uniref:GMC oxidoreductase n=1 Tax=Micromonospora coriariae TaxID=285665 RepID=UPI000B5AE0CE|nr:GMC oxidoreductase [Micromonospora coriariae]
MPRPGAEEPLSAPGPSLPDHHRRANRLRRLGAYSDNAWDYAAIAEMSGGYWHPVDTCATGPDSGPAVVAGAGGRIHKLSNVYVAAASLMPVIPRANTHLTTVPLTARLAESIG